MIEKNYSIREIINNGFVTINYKWSIGDMVKTWLSNSEFDGLLNKDRDCGCAKDFLFPCTECDSITLDECVSAYCYTDEEYAEYKGCKVGRLKADGFMSVVKPPKRMKNE